MKTRRKHRKTTTGRRRRHVKHRVQTRINHRKGTVSSGRRHKFFKRGGEPFGNNQRTTLFNTGTSKESGTYDPNTNIYIQSYGQMEAEQKNRQAEDAISAEQNAKKEAAEINYRAVVDFVKKVVPNKTKGIIGDFENIELTVKKLEKKDFYFGNVKDNEKQTPVTIKINDVTVKFYINYDGNTVVIYVDDMLYGYVMIKIEGKEYESDNRGIYVPIVSDAIKQDLIAASAS